MKIYVSHSVNFDYQNELYTPLKNIKFDNSAKLILPHDIKDSPKNLKKIIKKSDLVLAEVSHPATGQGIEIGWADIFGIPIICIYKKGFRPANSLKFITKVFIEYTSQVDMCKKLSKYLK